MLGKIQLSLNRQLMLWLATVFLSLTSMPSMGATPMVSSGSAHNCAVLSSGAVQCWGYNFYGQLGNATTTNSPTPVTAVGVTTAIAVAAGSSHSCAVLSGGGVQCWGRNSTGQLGNGTSTDSATPVLVSGINTAISVSVGSNHTCAVLSSGTVQCWGSNSSGQ